MKRMDFIEKKRHGTPEFPIEFYHLSADHPRYIMNAHWHKEFELIRVLEGSLILYLGNMRYNLTKGNIFAVAGGVLHRGEPKNCIYECLVFDPHMLHHSQNYIPQKYISPITDLQISIPQPFLENEQLQSTANTLFELMSARPPFYELEIYSHLFSLFSWLYRANQLKTTVNTPQASKSQTIMNLMSWLEQNFAEPLQLETLAKRTGLSQKYLCRIFKEYTSKPPMEYVTDLRIENACTQMTMLKKSITEAAFNSGFNDLSYFCKVFKRLKGITPREYKRQFSNK